MATCQQCGAACQGGPCEQCAVEKRFEHLAAEVAPAIVIGNADDDRYIMLAAKQNCRTGSREVTIE